MSNIIEIKFGASSPAAGVNGFSGSANFTTPQALVFNDNTASGATIQCLTAGNANNGSNVPAGQNFGVPVSYTDDYIFESSGSLGATYEFAGLADGNYSYTIVPSSNASPPRTSVFSWDGGSTLQSVDASGNIDQVITGEFTVSGGVISLTWGRANPPDGTAYLNYLRIEPALPSDPSILTPDSITGDGNGIAYTAIGASTTAPMRAQISKNGFVDFFEKELPTVNTDETAGTFDWNSGADSAAGGNGGQGIGAPYTVGGWRIRLIMLNAAGDADVLPLEITHQIKATGNPNVQEFSAVTYNATGNGRLKGLTGLIGDFDQLYHSSNQQTGGSDDPLTLDFASAEHPGPASIGGNSPDYAGPLDYAWYRTTEEKWVYVGATATPFTPPPSEGAFNESFDDAFD